MDIYGFNNDISLIIQSDPNTILFESNQPTDDVLENETYNFVFNGRTDNEVDPSSFAGKAFICPADAVPDPTDDEDEDEEEEEEEEDEGDDVIPDNCDVIPNDGDKSGLEINNPWGNGFSGFIRIPIPDGSNAENWKIFLEMDQPLTRIETWTPIAEQKSDFIFQMTAQV